MKDKIDNKLLRDILSIIKEDEKEALQRAGKKAETCLYEEVIADYLHDHLPEEDRNVAERHFILCDTCRRILTTLAKVEKSESAEPEISGAQTDAVPAIGDKIINNIAAASDILRISLRWVKGALVLKDTNSEAIPFSAFKGALAVRSETDQSCITLPPFSKTVLGYKVAVNIRHGHGQSCELLCKVISPVSRSKGSKIKLGLIQDKRLLCSYPLIGQNVSFSDINPGTYNILLQDGGKKVSILSLDIEGEKGND